MLSHSSSDASTRLRRAKSASSVQERRKNPLRSESVDPDAARLHALLAAHRAMERSSERASEELRRSASGASKRQAAGQGFRGPAQNVRFSPAPELRRQRSKLHAREHAPSSIPSSIYTPTEVSSTFVDGNQYESSPTAASEFGRAENYGAEPSSYRRLKKAKSFLTPRRRAISNADGTPPSSTLAVSRKLRNVHSSLGISESGFKLGLKRSLSYLRPSGSIFNGPKTSVSDAPYHQEAVQLAREQYLKDLEEKTLRGRPSSIFHPKIRNQQRAFRKSVRTSRLTDFGNGVKSANQDAVEDKPESRMRSFSASFRDRVMRVFGKSVSSRDNVPAQQLDATRLHFRDYMDGSATDGDAFDHYHAGEPEASSRQKLYIPAQQQNDAYEDLDRISANLKSAASRESLHSASRSRVTSWTNLTLTGSLRGSTPLERKRLSIIKEDGGPHQPSSSAGRHLGGVSVFQEPIGTPVDSQRIYSALMRRIDQEQAEEERARQGLDKIHQEQQLANKHAWRDTNTIRPVQSEESISTVAPDQDHREFSLRVPIWTEQTGIMTPAQHQENLERRKKKWELQETQSSFFPFSGGSERTIKSTPSPFKLALMERRRQINETETDNESDFGEEEGPDMVVHPDRAPASRGLSHRRGLGQGRHGMSADSIYSRTTNGGTNAAYIAPIGSSEDVCLDPLSEESSSAGLGMATIIPTRVNRYQYPRSTEKSAAVPRQRSASGSEAERGSGSSEWRSWMERTMKMGTTLERQQSKVSQRSHVRENAQIDGDDVEVGSGEAIKRFPLLELKEVSRGNTPAPSRIGSFVKGREGLLLKRRSVGVLSGSGGPTDENRRFETLRKISPGNVARLLRGKTSKSTLSTFGGARQNEGLQERDGGENEQAKETPGSTPPASTPGRLVMMYGGRNKVSEEMTPTAARGGRKKGQYHFQLEGSEDRSAIGTEDESGSPEGGSGGSGSVKKKGLFSARLSRPFDMDVPGHNRPFDSMFLGKGKDILGLGLSSGDPTDTGRAGGPGRLSVAPSGVATRIAAVGAGVCIPGVDGGVTPRSGDGSNTPASMSSTVIDGGSGGKGLVGLGMSSKRMVSNFLRSRRRNGSAAESPVVDAGLESESGKSSPAFV